MKIFISVSKRLSIHIFHILNKIKRKTIITICRWSYLKNVEKLIDFSLFSEDTEKRDIAE